MSSSATNYAKVKIKNHIQTNVIVQFYHHNEHWKSDQYDSTTWVIDAGKTNSGSMKAWFEPDSPTHDYWFLVVHVPEDAGSIKAGTYISSSNGGGTIANPQRSECQLTSDDVYNSGEGNDLQFSIDVINDGNNASLQFNMQTSEHHNSADMLRFRDYQQIQHVFVVMLENRSYDNILGYSGIDGATQAPDSYYNLAYDTQYKATTGAPATTVFDPGHEFKDVLVQLTGSDDVHWNKGDDYPQIAGTDDTGFALSYANKRYIDSGSLLYPVEQNTSPSVDSLGGNSVMAFSRAADDAFLIVLSPQSENYSNTVFDAGSDINIASQTSPVIAFMSEDPDSWVAAYSSLNGHKLTICTLTDSSSKEYQLAKYTSPAITRYGNGSWAAAIQNYGTGAPNSEYASLRVVQSDGQTYCPTEYYMQARTNPAICEYHHGEGWVAAYVDKDDNVIRTYKSTDTSSHPTNIQCYAASNTSPAIAYMEQGGHYAVAFHDRDNNQLGLYTSDSGGSTKRWPDHQLYSGSSPDLFWCKELQNWVIVYSRKSDGTLVETINGKEARLIKIQHERSGDSSILMAKGTNPSIARIATGNLTGAGHNRPNYIVGYQSNQNYAEARNAAGNLYITQARPSDVMKCFDTATELPVTYDLATNFTVCDNWFSSLPGPTWPNRFFIHGASSWGLDDSPEKEDYAKLFLNNYVSPFTNVETIYDRIREHTWPGSSNQKLTYHFYQDCEKSVDELLSIKLPWQDSRSGGPLGWIEDKLKNAAGHVTSYIGEHIIPHIGNPSDYLSIYSDQPNLGLAQAGLGYVPFSMSFPNIELSDFSSMNSFETDVNAPFDVAYTHIEPHYGDMVSTFRGGSSQHPMDNTIGGEGLLKAVYEKLRNSPLWYTSMLVVTYDEHGGFFDHVGPGASTAPEHGMEGFPNGFKFDNYGVRVPAMVISPLVAQGVATTPGSGDKPLYCHASVPNTLRNLFQLGGPLTDRDEDANSLLDLVTLSATDGTIRQDCPETLSDPLAPSAAQVQEQDLDLDSPIEYRGNLVGLLGNLAKFGVERAPTKQVADTILQLYLDIKTKRDAILFLPKVQALVAQSGEQDIGQADDSEINESTKEKVTPET